ncbi:MAG: glycosyltransferase family 2 protein [Candidatus Roizmanbacteria bacterium]
MNHISIIIPSYNGEGQLKGLLPSFYVAKSESTEFEILIVDNNSHDDSEKYVKGNFPDIQFIKLSSNRGFTGACNAGAKVAKGEYLLFLNNDCHITKEAIDTMIQFLENSKELVATQPIVYKRKMKDENIVSLMSKVESQKMEIKSLGEIENIGFVVDLSIGKAQAVAKVEDTPLPLSRGDLFTPFSLPTSHTFYGLSGTCLMIRKDIFKTVGMFDESFHSYHEDVDLAFRLTKAGYMYAPCLDAVCYHEHMATSSKMGSYKQRRDFLNWIRIIYKHYPHSYIIKHFPTLFVERLRNLNGVVKKLIKS